uniref:Uncharacterized protein n=1 Tax=Ralstonia syzygii R24 TaxID=907261 RepID=G3A7B1_9RALS|nr:hypothetical protein RALSY_40605 [Ralstonia syzygii R24]
MTLGALSFGHYFDAIPCYRKARITEKVAQKALSKKAPEDNVNAPSGAHCRPLGPSIDGEHHACHAPEHFLVVPSIRQVDRLMSV